MSFTPVVPITPYPFWNAFTPTLPTLYWDVDSHEERIKRICLEISKIIAYSDYLAKAIDVEQPVIKELQDAFQSFIDGEYDEYYENVIYQWIQDNFADVISAGVKQVYFGLTSNGYFCAYIPDSWNEITFDTGAVYGRSDYGRLILKFEADPNAQGVIDNTYTNFTLNGGSDLDALIADVEVTARRGDKSYETLFSNMDVEVPDANI